MHHIGSFWWHDSLYMYYIYKESYICTTVTGKFHRENFTYGKFHLRKISPMENSTYGKFHPRKIPPMENSTYGQIGHISKTKNLKNLKIDFSFVSKHIAHLSWKWDQNWGVGEVCISIVGTEPEFTAGGIFRRGNFPLVEFSIGGICHRWNFP